MYYGFLSSFSLNFIEIFVVFLIFFKNKRLLTGYFNYQLIFVAKSSSRGRRREEKGKEAGNACTRESFSNCPKNETKRSLELHCSNSWISRVRVEGGGESASNFPRLNIESHANPRVSRCFKPSKISSKGKSWRPERLSFREQSEREREDREREGV